MAGWKPATRARHDARYRVLSDEIARLMGEGASMRDIKERIYPLIHYGRPYSPGAYLPSTESVWRWVRLHYDVDTSPTLTKRQP